MAPPIHNVPSPSVRLAVDGIEIEVRRPLEAGVIQGAVDQSNLGDRIAAIGASTFFCTPARSS